MTSTQNPSTGASASDPALAMAFDLSSLHGLRAALAAHGTTLGLDGMRLGRLLVVATELATNAIRHGGGQGRLRLWSDSTAIFCQVSDDGPGVTDPEQAGAKRLAASAEGGRGLWIVRQFTDGFRIDNRDPGASVTVSIRL